MHAEDVAASNDQMLMPTARSVLHARSVADDETNMLKGLYNGKISIRITSANRMSYNQLDAMT